MVKDNNLIQNCQLRSLENTGGSLCFKERLFRSIARRVYTTLKRLRKAMSRVQFFRITYFGLKDLAKLISGNKRYETDVQHEISLIPTLNLQPGEKIRVKSIEEIRKTLDENGKYKGLAFTPAQKKYCGGTYVVLKRLERAFNEGTWKMFKMKDTVLLKDVVCDGKGGVGYEWDGCDRHCLLWWKEIWLERFKD